MKRWVTFAAVAVLVAAGLVLLTYVLPKIGGVDQMRQVLVSFGPWAVVISASLMVGQAIFAPLPANVITITNGLVFGPFWGGLLSWASMLLGSSLCYGLSRAFGKKFVKRFVGDSLETAERFFNHYGLQSVFVLRILPFVPFDGISYGAGIVGVPYWKFILATGIGTVPSILIYSYLGTIVAGAYWWILGTMTVVSGIVLVLASRYVKRLGVLANPAVEGTGA